MASRPFPRRTLANQHRGPANSVNLLKLGESKIVVEEIWSVNGRLAWQTYVGALAAHPNEFGVPDVVCLADRRVNAKRHERLLVKYFCQFFSAHRCLSATILRCRISRIQRFPAGRNDTASNLASPRLVSYYPLPQMPLMKQRRGGQWCAGCR